MFRPKVTSTAAGAYFSASVTSYIFTQSTLPKVKTVKVLPYPSTVMANTSNNRGRVNAIGCAICASDPLGSSVLYLSWDAQFFIKLQLPPYLLSRPVWIDWVFRISHWLFFFLPTKSLNSILTAALSMNSSMPSTQLAKVSGVFVPLPLSDIVSKCPQGKALGAAITFLASHWLTNQHSYPVSLRYRTSGSLLPASCFLHSLQTKYTEWRSLFLQIFRVFSGVVNKLTQCGSTVRFRV
ncbi:hypothetical protein VXM60_13840 [Shewanella khirikhana]|uniref:hypothetical protein n=1 Tax=Shewanella khirikhana TaxID=1965282 RepID=UPI0030CEFFC4